MVSKCRLWGISLMVWAMAWATAHHLVSTSKGSRSDDKFNMCAHQNEYERRCIAGLICSDLAHNVEQIKVNATEYVQSLVQEGRSKSEQNFLLDRLLTDFDYEENQNSQMDKIVTLEFCKLILQKCKHVSNSAEAQTPTVGTLHWRV